MASLMSRKPFLVLFLRGPPHLSAYVNLEDMLTGAVGQLPPSFSKQRKPICREQTSREKDILNAAKVVSLDKLCCPQRQSYRLDQKWQEISTNQLTFQIFFDDV